MAQRAKSTASLLVLFLVIGIGTGACDESDTTGEQNDTWTLEDTGSTTDTSAPDDTGDTATAPQDTSDVSERDTIADTSETDAADTSTEDTGADSDTGSADVADTSTSPDTSSTCGHGTASEIASTPRPDANLELLSLTLTDKVVAPAPIYERVTRDVEKIRKMYEKVSGIDYLPLHNGKSLIVQPDNATMTAIENGSYTAWDCLNNHYVKQGQRKLGSGNFLVLELKGVYDLSIVGGDYAALPGIKSAEPNGRVGDGPTICAKREGDVYHYVFDKAWGDCPAGCINHQYSYFTVDDGGTVTKEGEWERGGGSRPAWLDICNP